MVYEVKCLSLEHDPGMKINYLTPGKAPGYRRGLQPGDLEVKVKFDDGTKQKVSVKEFFRDYLRKKERKKFTPKVIAAIQNAMPSTLRVEDTGNEFAPYQIKIEDLERWAADVNL